MKKQLEIKQEFHLHPLFLKFISFLPKIKGYLQLTHVLISFLPFKVPLIKVTVHFGGKKINTFLDLRDKYQLDIVIKDKSELVIPCVIYLLTKKESIVFDIGANCGWYSRILSALSSGQVTILAFEPNRHAFAYLSKNPIPNFFPIPFALSDQPTKVMVGKLGFLRLSSGTIYHQKPNECNYAFNGAETCSTTVDAVAKALRLQPTVLKLDVEGYELEVLRGAMASLPGTEAVVVEINESTSHEGLKRKEEIFHLLQDHQFRHAYLISVRNRTIEAIEGRDQPAGDILFTKTPLQFL
jgi:FkbM family methyltransferase